MKAHLVNLVVCGCGTVGYWVTLGLLASKTRGCIGDIVLCDPAIVRGQNAVTCPRYAGYEGQFKTRRLCDLLEPRVERGRVATFEVPVERLDWDRVLDRSPVDDRGTSMVLAGLDNWQSRLRLSEDLRHLRVRNQAEITLVQVGLERGRAAVATMGCQFTDHCPACWLSPLPDPQPCVVLNERGRPLRGDLRKEARAAATWVGQVVIDSTTQGKGAWQNTRTNLTAVEGHYERRTRPCRRDDACLGPHTEATPLVWGAADDSPGGSPAIHAR